MDLASLLHAASFRPERVVAPPSWVGHIPFAAWLMPEVGPAVFVELGTHSGNSYLAFCQSVREAGLATKCYAVDTWRGDEHSGAYTEEVFSALNRYHEQRYVGFSQLLRTTFDEAAGHFTQGSVGLLHIDGLHTYEAVLHDFETWLPKLSRDAVVLFHDTIVRERGFGVYRLWEELCREYPLHLEFTHSHGLGVLQLHRGDGSSRLNWLEEGSAEGKLLVDYFAGLGRYALDSFAAQSARSEAASRRRVPIGRRIKSYLKNARLF